MTEAEIKKFRRRMLEIRRLEAQESLRHRETLAWLKEMREDAQRACPQTSKTYYPDPAGHDSEFVCDDCGACFSRKHPQKESLSSCRQSAWYLGDMTHTTEDEAV